MKRNRLKIILFVLSLCMLLTSGSIIAFADDGDTTSNYRYLQEYMNTEFNYPTIRRINASGMFALPGLEYTNLGDYGCNTMVPQGLCVAGDYVLISAYDGIDLYKTNLKELINVDINKLLYDNESSHNAHKSVIYVMSKYDKRYLTTLVLPDVNHVGGIAFDGEFLWIAKSSTRTLSAIDYATISNAVASGEDSVSVKYYQTVSCGMTASMVTYYDNRLWVGLFNQDTNGSLKGFDVVKTDKGKLFLFPYRSITLPAKANGVALATINGKTEMVVNTSYGRNSASNAYFYTLDINKDSKLSEYTSHPKLKLPPMAEEICIDGSDVYTIFESGATTYSGVCDNRAKNIVDRVCISNVYNYFPWTNSNTPDPAPILPSPVEGIYLTKKTTSSISLSWDPVINADGYYIYRYITSSNSLSLQATVDAFTNTFTQTGLKAGTDYDYLVLPFNSNGRARTSKMLYAMTLPKGTKLKSVSSSKKNHSITAKWNKVDKVTGYEIQYSTDKNFKKKVSKKVKSANTLSYTAQKLKKGKKYYVRVRAYKTYEGKSYYSSWTAKKTVTIK